MLSFSQDLVYRIWLCKKLDMPTLDIGCKTIASVRDGRILGVVAYQYFNGIDCHMLVAGEGKWLDRDKLRVFFSYPFNQMGCRRVTALCRDTNDKARRFVEKLGWTEEGVLRSYFDDGADCIIYGMLKEECRFLEE